MNPFKNLKLDQEEQEITEAIEKDQVEPIDNLDAQIKRFRRIAKYTFSVLHKYANR